MKLNCHFLTIFTSRSENCEKITGSQARGGAGVRLPNSQSQVSEFRVHPAELLCLRISVEDSCGFG